MSTVQGGGNIVTDGLVICLDAANTNSYVSGSTVWNDISRGGSTMTLINGPTFNSSNNGSIVFDGIDDRVSLTSNINTGQNFTVSAWIFPTLLGSLRRSIVANGYNYVSTNGWFFATGGGINNAFFLSIGTDLAVRGSNSNALTVNMWAFVSGVCINGGANILLYVNGREVPSYSFSVLGTRTITYTHPQLNVGFRDVGSANTDPYTGRIAQTTVNTRALTAAEILQNYNATKSRFGL